MIGPGKTPFENSAEFTGDINTDDLNNRDLLEYTGTENTVTVTISTRTIERVSSGNYFTFMIKNKTEIFVIFTIETEGSQLIDSEPDLILSFVPYGCIQLYTDGNNVYSIIQ